MKSIRKIVCILTVAVMILSMAGCSKKASAPADVNFTELEFGASIKDVEAKLGSGYTLAGSTPDRMTYMGIKLFDFLDKDENTKLTVFLNTENNAYAYAYYMYDAVDGNYSKLKAWLTERYGEPVEGENASEQWKDGETVYSVNNQGDYVAIGKF